MGDVPVPSYMLQVNQQDTEENKKLFLAAKEGSIEEAKKYIKLGGKVNYFYRPEDQKNSLHIAAENGHVDMVRLLLEHGAVVDSLVATSKSTSLILAGRGNKSEILKVLLEAGANIHAENAFGNTAFHEACREGYEKSIEILLAAGSNINGENHKGSTPLHFFCYGSSKTNTLEGMQKLIEFGADIHSRDHQGLTPCLVCCASGRMDLLQFLLEKGADPTAKDNTDRNGHDIALFYRQEQMAKFFEEESPYRRFAHK
eukprot:gene15518-20946_t